MQMQDAESPQSTAFAPFILADAALEEPKQTITHKSLFASGKTFINNASCTDGIQNGDEAGVDCGGSACQPCLENILNGEVTDDITLNATIEYELTGAYVIPDGGSLTIPAGTLMKATGGTSA